MADHDLFGQDDFFAKSQDDELFSDKEKKKKKDASGSEEKRQPEEPAFQPEEPQEPEEQTDIFEKSFDEQIKEEFEDNELEEREEQGIENDFEESDEGPWELGEEEEEEEFDEPEEEPARPRDNLPVIEDYEDEKQEKLNYKPFFIGFGVLVVLIAAFLITRYVFFAEPGDEKETADQQGQQTTTEEEVLSPEEQRRQEYFNQIAASTKQNINTLLNLLDKVSGNRTALSSVVIYEDDLLFEVYSKARDQLARLNMQFRNEPSRRYFLVSSNYRPGENGGVLGVFKLQNNGGGTTKASVTNALASKGNFDAWISELAQKNQLKIGLNKIRSTETVDNFSVSTLEASMSGSMSNCMAMLKQIANAERNIRLHKLAMSAYDQKNFSVERYRISLTLKLYI